MAFAAPLRKRVRIKTPAPESSVEVTAADRPTLQTVLEMRVMREEQMRRETEVSAMLRLHKKAICLLEVSRPLFK